MSALVDAGANLNKQDNRGNTVSGDLILFGFNISYSEEKDLVQQQKATTPSVILFDWTELAFMHTFEEKMKMKVHLYKTISEVMSDNEEVSL